MSGIEILGIAASVIQIAELGARLSVKLFVFSRKIKSADKSIDSISQDIAATGAVLQQLGSELSKDENAELCSNEALATTRNLVDSCMSVFKDLESSLDGRFSSSNSVVAGWKQRLKFPFLEAQIEVLRSNLERLKSSLLVMLNVLIFAAQVRSHRDIDVLKDHRSLVETLIEEKNASEKRYQQAQKHITWISAPSSQEETKAEAPMDRPSEGGSREWESASIFTVNTIALPNHEPAMTTSQTMPPFSKTSSLPAGLKYRMEEVQHHGVAVRSLLAEVDAFNRQISHEFRDKLQNGILAAHWEQWAPFRQVYGDQALLDAISEYPEVIRYWVSRLERETANLGTDSRVVMPNKRIGNSAQKPDQANSLVSQRQHSHLGAGQSGNHVLQDYQMQLWALEKQNKERLMMTRQEQDNAIDRNRAGPAHDPSALGHPPSHSETEGHATPFIESKNKAEPKAEKFDLNSSTLENSDVLDHFDFDSFLNTTDHDTIDFDGAIGVGGDIGLDPGDWFIGHEQGLPPVIEPGQSMKDQTRAVDSTFEPREESVVMALNKQQKTSLADFMQDKEDPWTSGHYLSHVDDGEPVDSSNIIGTESIEHDSLYAEAGGLDSIDLSMCSSRYEVSFLKTTDSVTASQLINGIGAASANQFLPLTAPADRRHTRTTQTRQPDLSTPRIDASEVVGHPSNFDDYIARWTRLSDNENADTAI